MKSVGTIIKILLLVMIFSVIAAFVLRFWMQSHYPASMRGLIPTEPLRLANAEGTLEVFSQDIRIGYENPNDGLFFADHMLVAPKTGSLQVSVRYNESSLATLSSRYGTTFDPTAEVPFEYRIFCSTGTAEDGETIIGTTYAPIDRRTDTFAMYHYERLAFEGISLEGVFWIRLDIYRVGEDEPEGSIVIYENHEKYNAFDEYKVSNKELS